MTYSVIVILVILIKFVSSMECPGCNIYDNLIDSFNDISVTDFVLTESTDVAKLMDCAVLCSRDIRCRSYRHNVLTETCSTYGAGYSLPEKTLNTVTAEAGSRLYAMCGMSKSFGSSCSTDAGCDFANSACLSGSCYCKFGFSYDVWTGDCLVRCSTYGDVFSLYPGAGIVALNTRMVLKTTQQACIQLCRVSSVTCISAEYRTGVKKCHMSRLTLSEIDATKMVFNKQGRVFWYRNCGF